MRAALSLLGPEVERKVFLFTSALPNEGKSFTSANYALALAQQGHRVLLIDGDLRRPSLHKIFVNTAADRKARADKENSPGLIDCLVGEADLQGAIRRVLARDVDVSRPATGGNESFATATGGELSILAGGRRAPNPAELLSGASFGGAGVEARRRSFTR